MFASHCTDGFEEVALEEDFHHDVPVAETGLNGLGSATPAPVAALPPKPAASSLPDLMSLEGVTVHFVRHVISALNGRVQEFRARAGTSASEHVAKLLAEVRTLFYNEYECAEATQILPKGFVAALDSCINCVKDAMAADGEEEDEVEEDSNGEDSSGGGGGDDDFAFYTTYTGVESKPAASASSSSPLATTAVSRATTNVGSRMPTLGAVPINRTPAGSIAPLPPPPPSLGLVAAATSSNGLDSPRRCSSKLPLWPMYTSPATSEATAEVGLAGTAVGREVGRAVAAARATGGDTSVTQQRNPPQQQAGQAERAQDVLSGLAEGRFRLHRHQQLALQQAKEFCTMFMPEVKLAWPPIGKDAWFFRSRNAAEGGVPLPVPAPRAPQPPGYLTFPRNGAAF